MRATGDELVRKLVEYMAGQEDVLAGYLFGSHATGQARPDSDVDVAVLLSEADDVERFDRGLRLGSEVSDVCGCEADLVVLQDAPSVLQFQILKNGRLVYERDRRARVEFEVQAGKIYADLEPHREYFRQALFKEIREVGLGGR